MDELIDNNVNNVQCVCAFRLNVRISCKRVTELDEKTVEWAFQLTKSNMQLL